MDVAREKLNSSVINSMRLKRFLPCTFRMTKICTFVLVEIFKIEVALGSVNRYRIKREEQKKKQKQNKKKTKKMYNERRGVRKQEGIHALTKYPFEIDTVNVSLWDKIDAQVLIKAFYPKVFNSQSRCLFHFHVLLFLDEQFFSINAFLSRKYRIISRKRNFYRVSDKKKVKIKKKVLLNPNQRFLIIVSKTKRIN